ncbi:MAG: hypothetical protein WKF92_06625 [Pyrinomonadaceae bacterium]
MKYCPNCQTQYTDETLKFCLQDGTPLAEQFAEPVTSAALDEDQTVISDRKQKLWNDMQARDPQTEAALPPPVQREVRTSKTPWIILTALLTSLLVAAGAWLYFRNQPDETAKASNSSNRQTGGNSVLNKSPSPTPGANLTADVIPANPNSAADESDSPPPPANRDQARDDVSKRIYDWTTLTESGEIDELMGNYANRVDYYLKPGASPEYIRNDKLRAFSEFDSIEFEIDNMNVEVDRSGEEATAEFDKSWNFGGQTRSEGKVRQQMKLKKIDGVWLITGERDLKLYYKR